MSNSNDNKIIELIEIAEAYYIEGLSQKEIAEKFYLSKSKVSRLINRCLEENIVQITINYPIKRVREIEEIIEKNYNLKEAIVIKTSSDNSNKSYDNYFEYCAQYLRGLITNNAYVGIGAGNTIAGIIDKFKPVGNSTGVKLIQLTGIAPKEQDYRYDSQILVREFAQKLNCEMELIFSPLYVQNPIVKSYLLEEYVIKKSIESAKRADIILCSVSTDLSHRDARPSEWSSFIDLKKLNEMQKTGPVSVMLSHFIDTNGNIVDEELDSRFIGINLEDLRKIQNVILVAKDKRKALGVYCALNTGTINTLITTDDLANSLIKLPLKK